MEFIFQIAVNELSHVMESVSFDFSDDKNESKYSIKTKLIKAEPKSDDKNESKCSIKTTIIKAEPKESPPTHPETKINEPNESEESDNEPQLQIDEKS